jgi:3-hydroxy-9,10-secoandrosta-1,3,5(10)-triene-9,17-dione monooxygenase reductase component
MRRIAPALAALSAGRMVVVADNSDREDEGDLVLASGAMTVKPPLVSFAPARTSSSWPQVRAARRFCINMLADDQCEVSDAFARSGADRFADVEWRPSLLGAPVLAGVVASIDCQLWAEYDGGDHTVVVASVIDLGADPARAPLLFHRGPYGLQCVAPGKEEA